MKQYFVLGGVPLRVEHPSIQMDYQLNTITKGYLNYPGSHVIALPGDGKDLEFTVVVISAKELEKIRKFWKKRTPLPLVSVNKKAGYNVKFVITKFVQKDYDNNVFRFDMALQEFTKWKTKTKKFKNWKVTSKKKKKCPKKIKNYAIYHRDNLRKIMDDRNKANAKNAKKK